MKNIKWLFFMVNLLINFFIDLFQKKSKVLGKQLCNALNTNQFEQTNIVGVLDLTTNPNPFVMTVRIDPALVGDVIPGEGVILTDLGASDAVGPPFVDQRAADANAIEGAVIFDTKSATKQGGDLITIAKKNAVIVMEAAAAILRGAKVALVLASPGQVVTLTGEALFGKALDKAAAAGTLIRIEVLAEGVV
jgi:hypothetical protein